MNNVCKNITHPPFREVKATHVARDIRRCPICEYQRGYDKGFILALWIGLVLGIVMSNIALVLMYAMGWFR